MIVGDDYKVPTSKCLACDRIVNAATCVGEDASPVPGDITVCIECGHIMAYSDDLLLRELTDSEAKYIAGDERVLLIQRGRGEIRKE